jgi:hypothetical protein
MRDFILSPRRGRAGFDPKHPLAQQMEFQQLEGAVIAATRGGIQYDKIIQVGQWELKFAKPRSVGEARTSSGAMH